MTDIGTLEEWQRIAEAQSHGASQSDGGCIAMFYTRPVQDKAATEREGRTVFKSVPYVEIRIAGQPRTVIDREATDADKKRFPRAWNAFEAGEKGIVDGTPIETWPYLNRAQVAELRVAGIQTIEQLAAVSDGDLGKLGPGARNLRERAQQQIKGAGDTEQDLRSEVADLKQQLSAATSKIQQLVDGPQPAEEPKRGPGRPRKAA